jgi:predicted nuclease with RNAse H fold
MPKFIGIDFSGNEKMWRPHCARSNVWLAEVEGGAARPTLVALNRVQEIAGNQHPFKRLCAYVSQPGLSAVAIDAPFSLPARFLPSNGWSNLLRSVAAIPLDVRPFPFGQALVDGALAIRPLDEPKPLRATERHWRDRSINVRSTLWNGPRGGAPFTAACLRLIADSKLPAWPWSPANKARLVEAFPAAQLFTWGLPTKGYDKNTSKRLSILDDLDRRLTIPKHLRAKATASADALDAILCAFAAIAVIDGQIACPLPDNTHDEGWIAVHT